MKFIQSLLRRGFEPMEAALSRVFTPAWNPLYQLGAIGFFFLWIVVASGVYIYIFFDTSIHGAYSSMERLTYDQWYFGGVMRSFHRYASDGMVVVMVLHMLREFALDRFRGVRWFSWATGTPVIWLVIISGITGYWLVWDQLAQYIAVNTTEWLDLLPIFGGTIARNFLTNTGLSDRFFTLLVFLHIAVPLFLVFTLWIHIVRVSRAKVNPAFGLMAGITLMLLALSFIKPAVSQPPADMALVPGELAMDWYYLAFFPLLDSWPGNLVWAFAGIATLLLMVVPWLPRGSRVPAAVVDLDNCNGCTRCVEDCPYNAVTMMPRSDGKPFPQEAVVKPKLCVGCGICAGACPSSTPFRRAVEPITGIDLPDRPIKVLRQDTEQAAARLTGPSSILVYSCRYSVAAKDLENSNIAVVDLPCIAALPPSFIDYVLSRKLAGGVALVGCPDSGCYNRFGVEWMKDRIDRKRDPHLRQRVPRDRIAALWIGRFEKAKAKRELQAFSQRLAQMTPAHSEEDAGVKRV